MFKKELEKAGKGIGSMTHAEKKAFFNKIDSKYTAKNEQAKNPYAIGMAAAMKAKDDKPPLKKSTITKAHDIAKSIKKEGFASDAQRKAAFASGYKEKGKDKKEDTEWKTFAQLRTEVDEACWDSHKQVGFKMKGGKRVPNCVPKNEDTSYPSKDDKIKGDNPADKGEKEQQAGEDTRDKNKKTMTGQVATSPEMNPKVDYKY